MIFVIGIIYCGTALLTLYIILRIVMSRKVRKLPKYPPTDIKTDTYTRTYFRIPISDGSSLAAYWYQPIIKDELHPQGQLKRTGVTMISTHGFQNTALARDDVELATALVEQGHVVIAYDSRQHGNSTTKKYAYYRPDYFPKAMIQDPLEVIDYVKKMPNVDPNHLGFIGFSYGGITALTGAIADPDIKLIIAGCAVYNYNKLWGYHLVNTDKALRYGTKEVFFHRQKFEDFHNVFEQVSPENRARLLHPSQTICLLHCRNDPLVVFDINFPQLKEAYGVPDERAIVFEKGGHDFRTKHEDVKNYVLKWINQYLLQ